MLPGKRPRKPYFCERRYTLRGELSPLEIRNNGCQELSITPGLEWGRIVSTLQACIDQYGPEAGPKLYQVLQSQAAHAGVSARLRRKIFALAEQRSRPLPLFPEPAMSGPATSE